MPILKKLPKLKQNWSRGMSPRNRMTIDGESKTRCIEISNHVVDMIEEVRSSSEAAVLNAGEQLSAMFDLAKLDNELAVGSLHRVVGNENQTAIDQQVDTEQSTEDVSGKSDQAEQDPEQKASIRGLIDSQKVSIQDFLGVTGEFLEQQTMVANESYHAISDMEGALGSIQRILLNSKILAVNAQIESTRLGDKGKAVYVLGGEMARFTKDIAAANEAIQSRVANVTSAMLRFRDEARAKHESLKEFSERIEAKLNFVQERTDVLMSSLEETSDRMVSSQSRLVRFSHEALSALQFQDPMAQKLRRVEHEIGKLRSFMESGEFCDTDLADISDEVGRDGSEERDTGVVDLF